MLWILQLDSTLLKQPTAKNFLHYITNYILKLLPILRRFAKFAVDVISSPTQKLIVYPEIRTEALRVIVLD